MRTSTNPSLIAAISVISLGLGIASPKAHAVVFFADDFSSGTVASTFRVYENRIDTGWIKAIGYGAVLPSEWDITGGSLGNPSTVSGSGYPTTQPSETPVSQIFSNPIIGNPADMLTIEFDYNVAAGDTLYAHFWGVTGTATNTGQISNIEAGANGNVNNGPGGGGSTLLTYNLTDGATSGFGATSTAISGALTGSGTSSTTVNVASFGIPGITSVGDFDYFYVAFAKNEDGIAGTTSIDNLVISIPEPSRAILLSLGLLAAVSRRKR